MRLILALILVVAAAGPAAAGIFEMRHGGVTRRAHIDEPRGPRPAPAVIVLHGGSVTASRMPRVASFELADRGWAVIYPAAIDGRWQQGDGDYIWALIQRLTVGRMVDPRRVYLAGFGEGGEEVLRILCAEPGLAAGAAVVAAALPSGADCPDAPPVPVLMIHGTADPQLNFERARDTAARLARRNRCGAFEEIPVTDFYDDGMTVTMHAYRGCEARTLHYVVEGGGHAWPGNRYHEWVETHEGRAALDISATFEIEAFFQELDGR